MTEPAAMESVINKLMGQFAAQINEDEETDEGNAYAHAVRKAKMDGKKKGDVFGPIRTGLGFSIVKILDVRGREVVEVEEVRARHILIEPTIILSEAKAEEMLQGFLDQIAAGEADFAELAQDILNKFGRPIPEAKEEPKQVPTTYETISADDVPF